MDLLEGVQKLLTLLFGQMGVVGTLLTAVCVYLGWEIREERAAHKATREMIYELQEKRLLMHAANLEAINEVKQSLDDLAQTIPLRSPRK